MSRNFHQPGRSAVLARNGMAATSHPLATGGAIDMLKAGGNAVDGAIAAAAILAVVEPQMTGIGGDCFAIIAKNDGSLIGLNGSGRAARAITTDKLLADGIDEIGIYHGLSVTVPGAVDGWARLNATHGKLGLDRLLTPAIDLARGGAPTTARVATDWASLAPDLHHAGWRQHYLKADGTPPQEGDVMCFPALADVLAGIAADGPDAFYRGPVAAEIAATVQAAGGKLDEDDLAAVAADFVTPIDTAYRDYRVAELPPSTQGITALLMLGILDRFPPAATATSAERYHREMEAARLAYALRDRYLSDPDTADMDVGTLLSDDHLARLAARIDPSRRMADASIADPRAHTDTVYLSVVDGDRMAVSFINSIFHGFGSGIVTPKSGVTLQNRGACFVVKPGHPNTIEGSKRPLHTLIPGMLMRDGRWTASFGVMGGQYQACGHAHLVQNLVDFDMDPQTALDCPRVFFDADGLVAEAMVSETTMDGLRQRDHRVGRRDDPLGGGQAIWFDRARDILIAGSDPRKDGCALGY